MAEQATRTTLLIVVLALASAGAGLVLGRWMAGSSAPPAVLQAAVAQGEPLPDVALPDLDGTEQPLSRWRGRPVLINFWATWCGPCIEEMPILDAFAREQGGNGVQVVGIALDEAAAVRSFLEEVPVGYPVLLGGTPGSQDLSVRLGNRHSVLPYSVLVDEAGRLVDAHIGDLTAEELAAWVREHGLGAR